MNLSPNAHFCQLHYVLLSNEHTDITVSLDLTSKFVPESKEAILVQLNLYGELDTYVSAKVQTTSGTGNMELL